MGHHVHFTGILAEVEHLRCPFAQIEGIQCTRLLSVIATRLVLLDDDSPPARLHSSHATEPACSDAIAKERLACFVRKEEDGGRRAYEGNARHDALVKSEESLGTDRAKSAVEATGIHSTGTRALTHHAGADDVEGCSRGGRHHAGYCSHGEVFNGRHFAALDAEEPARVAQARVFVQGELDGAEGQVAAQGGGVALIKSAQAGAAVDSGDCGARRRVQAGLCLGLDDLRGREDEGAGGVADARGEHDGEPGGDGRKPFFKKLGLESLVQAKSDHAVRDIAGEGEGQTSLCTDDVGRSVSDQGHKRERERGGCCAKTGRKGMRGRGCQHQ
jgi:hypothetical protein